jgi:hypothetical protein
MVKKTTTLCDLVKWLTAKNDPFPYDLDKISKELLFNYDKTRHRPLQFPLPYKWLPEPFVFIKLARHRVLSWLRLLIIKIIPIVKSPDLYFVFSFLQKSNIKSSCWETLLWGILPTAIPWIKVKFLNCLHPK